MSETLENVAIGAGSAAVTYAAVEAWRRAAERTVLDNKPATMTRVDARALTADADTFQFKGGGDRSGVTDRLQGVKKWNAAAAGKVMIYEYADGRQVVADGHQRLGLAKRLMSEGHDPIKMDAIVLRERDGWAPRDVRAYAAIKNMHESSGASLDMAKVMRERPDLVTSSLPLSDAKVREARALSHLSEPAFKMVVGGAVEPGHAAAVGEAVKDATRHADMLKEMVDANVKSAQHARLYVQQAMAAPSVTETTASLFGEETTTRSLVKERAQVLDRALSSLKHDKRLFAMLSREADAIEEAGNRLAKDANTARADTSARTAALVEKLATTRGHVSSLLDRAAEALAQGKSASVAAREFTKAVKDTMAKGGIKALVGDGPMPLAASGSMQAMAGDRQWQSPPRSRAEYIDDRAYARSLSKPYFDGDKKVASSRTTPFTGDLPKVGSWRMSGMKGIHGHEIEQLVRVPIKDLALPELDSAGKLDPMKAGDEMRYAQWLKEGKRAPPIEIVETDKGTMRVMDGHRRALAAKIAGQDYIEAWVSRTVPVPDGRLDSNGNPLKTGLTFEIATGENGMQRMVEKPSGSTAPTAGAVYRDKRGQRYTVTGVSDGKVHVDMGQGVKLSYDQEQFTRSMTLTKPALTAFNRHGQQVSVSAPAAPGQTSFLPAPTTKEQVASAAKSAGKPSVVQQPMDDGLFGSGMKQTDLVDMARAKAAEPSSAFTSELSAAAHQGTKIPATASGMQPAQYANNAFIARVGNQEFTAYVEREGKYGWKVTSVSESSIDPKYGAGGFVKSHKVSGYYPSAQAAADAALDGVRPGWSDAAREASAKARGVAMPGQGSKEIAARLAGLKKSDLLTVAKEVGASGATNRASAQALRAAIQRRVTEEARFQGKNNLAGQSRPLLGAEIDYGKVQTATARGQSGMTAKINAAIDKVVAPARTPGPDSAAAVSAAADKSARARRGMKQPAGSPGRTAAEAERLLAARKTPKTDTVAALRARAKDAGVNLAGERTKAQILAALERGKPGIISTSKYGSREVPAAPAPSKVPPKPRRGGKALAALGPLAIVGAGAVAFDSTRNQALAAGQSPTSANLSATRDAAAAALTIAGIGYGIGKAAQLATKVAPLAGKVLARALPVAGLGYLAYEIGKGAVKAYREGGGVTGAVKGGASAGADFATMGAWSHFAGKGDAGGQQGRLTPDQATAFQKADAMFRERQAAEKADPDNKGWSDQARIAAYMTRMTNAGKTPDNLPYGGAPRSGEWQSADSVSVRKK